MKKVLTLIFLFSAFVGFSQNRTVSGIILDKETKAPIHGAIVVATGTQIATPTATDGKFSLSVPTSVKTVEARFMGYITKVVDIAPNLVIELDTDTKAIDEIVIVNYGAVKKSDRTGSVDLLKGADIMKSSPVNIQSVMQGRVAGVNITQNDGAPGGGVSIQIRGTNSFMGGTEPLFVIDGVPLFSAESTTAGDATGAVSSFNPLSFLNPNDIEDIEILKDASATAIYGSRGSNGVILITTKSGKSPEDKIEFSYNVNIAQVSNKLHMLSGREYSEYRNLTSLNTALLDMRNISPGDLPFSGIVNPETGDRKKAPWDFASDDNTYWQDQIFRTAISHDANIMLSGSNKGTSYTLSGGYLDQQGIVKNSSYKRYSVKLNLNRNVKQWLDVGTSTSISTSVANMLKNATTGNNNGGEGVIRSALYFPATYHIDDTAVQENEYKYVTNPLLYANALNQTKSYSIYTSNYAQANLGKGFLFRTSIGFNSSFNFNNQYFGRELYEGRNPVDGLSVAGDNSWESLVFDNLLMYLRDFNKHNISATFGTSWESSKWYSKSTSVNGFGTDVTQGWLLGDGSTIRSAGSNTGDSKLFSLIFRAAYNYAGKYYLTFTARNDSSSKFRKGNRAAFFPSAGISYRISEEEFMQPARNVISNAKLRYSYGAIGNQGIGSYATFALMESENYPFGTTIENGYAINPWNPGNVNLRWETTYQHDLGLDLTLFKNIDITLDLYHKTTKDLLQYKQTASSTGITQIMSNFGSVENKGIELSANARIVNKRNIKFNLGGNISVNRNKIIELGTEMQFPNTLWTNWRPFVLAEGRPIGQAYGFVEDGIWGSKEEVINSAIFKKIYPDYVNDGSHADTEMIIRQNWVGEIKYKDLTNDDIIGDDDQKFLGNTSPKFTYGFNTNLQLGKFDFNMLWQGVYGNVILNQPLIRFYNIGGDRNLPVDILKEAWSPENPNGTAPKVYSTNGRTVRISNRYFEDGSYLKLRTVSLAYNFSKPFKGVSNLKAYVSANNILTFTNYSGFDPEVNTFGSSPTTRGVDGGGYPQYKSFIFGINLTF